MKEYKILLSAVFIPICMFIMTNGASAVITEPDNIIYGRVSMNEKVLSSGTVSLKVEDNLIAFSDIGSNPDAADCYILRIPIDAYDPPRPGALQPGDEASIYINDMAQPVKTIIIKERGIVQEIDLGLEDSDQDGLNDGEELTPGTDLNNSGLDDNALSDGQEYDNDTGPLNEDNDMMLFTARIQAAGQGEEHGLADAYNISAVDIGRDLAASTSRALGPPENWTVYMRVSGNLCKDVRQRGSNLEEWILSVDIGEYADPGLDGYYPLLSWDPDEFYPMGSMGIFRLYSVEKDEKLTLLVEDMYQTSHYQTKEEEALCISSAGCWLTYSIIWSSEAFVKMNLPKGLSMVSLAVIPDSLAVSDIFPTAEMIYDFDEHFGYVPLAGNEEMEAGKGYWVLLPEEQNLTLTGEPVREYITPAGDGWMMIGSCTSSAYPSVDTGDIEVIYGFEPGVGYQPIHESDRLEPGKGYWVLLSNTIGQSELRIGEGGLPDQMTGPGSVEEEWRLPITATTQREEYGFTGAVEASTVYIGTAENASSFEAALPPPRWTVSMKLKDSFQSRYYYQDIRQNGTEKRSWTLKVELNNEYAGPEIPGFYPVLSWDPSKIPAGNSSLKLKHGETGEILVDNMCRENSYQTREKDGVYALWYTIAFEPGSSPNSKGNTSLHSDYRTNGYQGYPQAPGSHIGLSQYGSYNGSYYAGSSPSSKGIAGITSFHSDHTTNGYQGYPQAPGLHLGLSQYGSYNGGYYAGSSSSSKGNTSLHPDYRINGYQGYPQTPGSYFGFSQYGSYNGGYVGYAGNIDSLPFSNHYQYPQTLWQAFDFNEYGGYADNYNGYASYPYSHQYPKTLGLPLDFNHYNGYTGDYVSYDSYPLW